MLRVLRIQRLPCKQILVGSPWRILARIRFVVGLSDEDTKKVLRKIFHIMYGGTNGAWSSCMWEGGIQYVTLAHSCHTPRTWRAVGSGAEKGGYAPIDHWQEFPEAFFGQRYRYLCRWKINLTHWRGQVVWSWSLARIRLGKKNLLKESPISYLKPKRQYPMSFFSPKKI